MGNISKRRFPNVRKTVFNYQLISTDHIREIENSNISHITESRLREISPLCKNKKALAEILIRYLGLLETETSTVVIPLSRS